LWEKEVHPGYSGAAIRDGKAYFIDRNGDASILRCMDMASGRQLWEVSIDDPGEIIAEKYKGTRGTPVVTEEAAYFVTDYGTFACVDLDAGKVKWKHHILKDYDTGVRRYGVAQSPSLYRGMVLIAPHAPDVGVAAYDRTSGKRLWTSPGLGFHAYISPRVERVCGEDMVIAGSSSEKEPIGTRLRRKRPGEPEKELAPSHIAGLSPRDGSILWDYTGWRCQLAIPHPVALPDNRFFITGGYDAGSAMIQVQKTESGFEVKELYKTDEVGSQLHLPVQMGGTLFIGSTSNSRNDGMASFSLDGKRIWRTKDVEGAPLFERSPFILVDGKLVALDAKSGVLYLLKADPEKYTELASAKLFDESEMSWAPMALSDGRLLVRDWTTLKCLDLK
jgi:outer membrane protein assembly factor BamB